MTDEEREELRELSRAELIEMIEALRDEIDSRRVTNDLLGPEYRGMSANELARRLAICERVRKHWRILAVGVALGRYNLDKLAHVCAMECMGDVPTNADMDPLLESFITEIERRASVEQQLGPLRSILLT